MLEENLNTSANVDKIKGTVTVELFDAKTGKLVEKQQNHNFIANHGREYLKYVQRTNFKNQISVLGSGADTDYAIPNVFDTIVLTDSTEPTDPANEWSLPGNLMGYALKTQYSGADTLLGSPNTALSETTESYTKWVFDWPTHAAVGTIGSLSWHVNTSPYGGSLPFPEPVVSSTTSLWHSTAFNASPLAHADEDTIFTASGSTVSVRDANLNVTLTFPTITAAGIAWDNINEKIWVISTNQIASYSNTGTIIDGPISITNRSYRGLTFDGTYLWSTSDDTVYQLNSSGADVYSFAPDIGVFHAYAGAGAHGTFIIDLCWSHQEELLYIMVAGIRAGSSSGHSYQLACEKFTTSGERRDSIITLNPFYNGNTRGAYKRNNGVDYIWQQYMDITNNRELYFSAYNGSGGSDVSNPYPSGSLVFKARVDGMGSRCLLPSPITKTDEQTLRITYQMDYS